MSGDKQLDRWADWLLEGRTKGHSKAQVRGMHGGLNRVRDRILKDAGLKKGHRVLDVGAGTGLVALAARRRVGQDGWVVASDVSADALLACRRSTEQHDGLAPLAFAGADLLRLPFADETFDAAFTRSVLIYLHDKPAGIAELRRVLKPGGRASLFEPINEVLIRGRDRWPLELGGEQQTFERVRAHLRAQAGERDPLVGFDERDLMEWFIAAGFTKVGMTFEHAYGANLPFTKAKISAWLVSRANPLVPTYEEAARAVLGDAAGEHLVRLAGRLLEVSRTEAQAVAYVVAVR